MIGSLAQVVVSTNEPLESFISLHSVNIDKVEKFVNFGKFADFLSSLFRLPKYEAYLVYE